MVGDRAEAQIRPPIVVQPETVRQPPVGYPPTTAPSATGPYFARPAWDQTLPANSRFVILTNFNSNAVLDRETGLVWARTNLPSRIWSLAERSCAALVIGNRSAWRLPSRHELLTLFDASVQGDLRLPAGHPFFLSPDLEYDGGDGFPLLFWTSEFERFVSDPSPLAISGLGDVYGSRGNGNLLAGSRYLPWCVRGQ